MLQLKSLQEQLETLVIARDHAIENNKTFAEVREIQEQIKFVQKLIYERKIQLKREGLFTND